MDCESINQLQKGQYQNYTCYAGHTNKTNGARNNSLHNWVSWYLNLSGYWVFINEITTNYELTLIYWNQHEHLNFRIIYTFNML